MTTPEQQAIHHDAQQRLQELRAVARSLWPDRDDPEVLSELVNTIGQIRQAEKAIYGDNWHRGDLLTGAQRGMTT